MRRLSFLLLGLASCGGSLSDVDQGALREAAVLNGMAYAHADAGSAESALERGAYCATAGIMLRQKLVPPDAGIACVAP